MCMYNKKMKFWVEKLRGCGTSGGNEGEAEARGAERAAEEGECERAPGARFRHHPCQHLVFRVEEYARGYARFSQEFSIEEQLLGTNVKRFRGGLIFKAPRLHFFAGE